MMTANEIVKAAQNLGYVEGGIQTRNFTAKLSLKADSVVVAVNNGDIAGAYAKLFLENFEKTVEGAKILAEIHGAKNVTVHIPTQIADEVRSKLNVDGVEFVEGLVNKRNYPNAIYHHAATALNISELSEGKYTDGIYVSVNGSDMKKYDPEMTLCEIAEKCSVKCDDVTAVISGFKLLTKEALSQPVCEILPENGCVKLVYSDECSVKLTAEVLSRAYATSCGKCTFCREGLNQLALMIADIADGKGKIAYIEIMREIASAMKDGTLCTLGQNCGDIALGLITNENAEVVKHIKRKKCTPGVCFSNDTYYVDPEKCSGCAECLGTCPADAILGKEGYIHMIDDLDCTRCGKCLEKCPEGAIKVTTARAPKLPDRLTRVGQFRRY